MNRRTRGLLGDYTDPASAAEFLGGFRTCGYPLGLAPRRGDLKRFESAYIPAKGARSCSRSDHTGRSAPFAYAGPVARRFGIFVALVGAGAALWWLWSKRPEQLPDPVGSASKARVPSREPITLATRTAASTRDAALPDDDAPAASPTAPRGHVRCIVQADGKPVVDADVRLCAQAREQSSLVASGRTDTSGQVDLGLGSLRTWSRHRLHTHTLAAYARKPGLAMPNGLPVVLRTVVRDDLTLGRGPLLIEMHKAPLVVRARLVFPDGTPAHRAEATVTCETQAPVEAYSGPEGHVAIPVPVRESFTLHAGIRDCEQVTRERVVLRGEGDIDLGTVRIPRPPHMTGRIRFADGSPVADLTFVMEPWRDPGPRQAVWDPDMPYAVMRTDAQGRFEAYVPEWGGGPGHGDFMIELPGLDPEEEAQWFGFDASKRNQTITIKHHRLIIRCEDEHGDPVVNLPVAVDAEGYMQGTDSVTDDRGQVSWFLPREENQVARVTLVGAGRIPIARRVPIPPNENTVVTKFVLPAPRRPVAARLRVVPPPPSGAYPLHVDVKEANTTVVAWSGKWEAAGGVVTLPPGRYNAEVWVTMYAAFGNEHPSMGARHVIRGIHIDEDGARPDVLHWPFHAGLAVRFEGDGTATASSLTRNVVVERQDGTRAYVAWQTQQGRWPDEEILAGARFYARHLLPPGTYVIRWIHKGYEPDQQTVRLNAHALTEATIVLQTK